MKPIEIVIHDCRKEELYSKISYLSSMIPIRQERRRDAIRLSDGLIRPVIIIGKYGDWSRLAGLRPDFWIAGDDDCRTMLTLGAVKVGGVELKRIEDVLKIVEILRLEREWIMYENFINEISTKVTETRDEFIFQTISSWIVSNYQITVSKDTLSKAVVLIKMMEDHGVDICEITNKENVLYDEYMRGYRKGYQEGCDIITGIFDDKVKELKEEIAEEKKR